MAKVIITEKLEEEINKIFKHKSIEIFSLMLSLEENPKKGKEISSVGKILIKEIRYEKFRFYFITDGYKVKFLKTEELQDLLIKFVRMSEKNDQQKTIDEIKRVLMALGEEGF
jgi:activator of HSP90 ATPase